MEKDNELREIATAARLAVDNGDLMEARRKLDHLCAVDIVGSVPYDVRMRMWEILGAIERAKVAA